MRYRLISFAMLGALSLTPMTPVMAQTSCTGQLEYTLQQSIPLADTLLEQTGSGPWPRIFHQKAVGLSYEAGQKLLLTGGPKGLRTDDLARIDVAPSGQHWEHDFRNAARTHIIPLQEKPDLSSLFTEGSNQITITLKDMFGPAWSTSAYTLEVWEPCQKPSEAITTTKAQDETSLADLFPPDMLAAIAENQVMTLSMPGETTPANIMSAEAITAVTEGIEVTESQTMTTSSELSLTDSMSSGVVVAIAENQTMSKPDIAVSTLTVVPTTTPPATAKAATIAQDDQYPGNESTTPVAPVQNQGSAWPFLIRLTMIAGAGWFLMRHRASLEERLPQLRETAMTALHNARQQVQALWHEYAEEHVTQIVKVIVENNSSKRH